MASGVKQITLIALAALLACPVRADWKQWKDEFKKKYNYETGQIMRIEVMAKTMSWNNFKRTTDMWLQSGTKEQADKAKHYKEFRKKWREENEESAEDEEKTFAAEKVESKWECPNPECPVPEHLVLPVKIDPALDECPYCKIKRPESNGKAGQGPTGNVVNAQTRAPAPKTVTSTRNSAKVGSSPAPAPQAPRGTSPAAPKAKEESTAGQWKCPHPECASMNPATAKECGTCGCTPEEAKAAANPPKSGGCFASIKSKLTLTYLKSNLKYTIGFALVLIAAITAGVVFMLGRRNKGIVIAGFPLKKVILGVIVLAGVGFFMKPKSAPKKATIFTAGLSGSRGLGIRASVSKGGSMEVWILILFLVCGAGAGAYWYFYIRKPQRYRIPLHR